MRISDWSSDVCSSDLAGDDGGGWGFVIVMQRRPAADALRENARIIRAADHHADRSACAQRQKGLETVMFEHGIAPGEQDEIEVGKIGRATCRERRCK